MNTREQILAITSKIRDEAKRRKLTHGQLAQKWGVTKSYVSVIMRGERIPYIETLDKIAASMGIEATIKIGVPKREPWTFGLIPAKRKDAFSRKGVEVEVELNYLTDGTHFYQDAKLGDANLQKIIEAFVDAGLERVYLDGHHPDIKAKRIE